ncbi:MAG TPA: efflux RND transporter permease subunit [Candidatus Eisenbacteria bacterium]|nr:efflux RND transporter permease subunit [Candidatus Eisenbacteria bacterium]
MNLPRWSLRNPITAGTVVVSMLVMGAIAAPRLPLAFLPEVSFPGLEITIPYPNALPAQVEEEITRPAEEALATLSKVRRINSWSSANSANIYVEFNWGEDIAPIRAEAREKLDRIRDRLPQDVDVIQVNSFRSSDIPVIECRIAADRDLSRDYELLNRHVADPLRRVPGVAKVELYGVEPPQVRIDFRLADLERHGLDAGAVLARLDASSRSSSAGMLRRGDEAWPLRVVNDFESIDEFRSFPITEQGLRLGDVATIALREPDLDYGRHLDLGRAIGLNVIKESGANNVEVSDRARRVLKEIESDPQLKGIRVLTFTDQGEQIRNSLEGLAHAGLVGAALSVGVLFFFLRRLGTTLMVAAAIPFSLLATAALMYFTGRTLNILSMMGLMLAVGMLVDNAVVVLESITRHRERGMAPLKAAIRGSREVLPAVVSATATSIIVFLPLVLGGRTEITTWIGEVGRTIIFTLLCSLFLSLTVIPLAMGRLFRVGVGKPSPIFLKLSAAHQRALAWTLRHRPAASGIALAVFVAAIAMFIPVDKSAFTATKVEAVNLRYEFADNLNYREVERYVTAIETWIQARKESLHVKSTYSYFGNNEAFTRAYLADGWADDEGAQKVRKMLRDGLPQLPGTTLRLQDNQGQSGSSRLAVRLFGEPGPRLDQLAREVSRRLATVEGLTDVVVGGERGREEVEVVVDRQRAAQYGLTTATVGNSVAGFFRGRQLARFRGSEGEVQVQARLDEKDRSSLHGLRDMPVMANRSVGGVLQSVPLAAVADFHVVRTPSSVERQQRHSVVAVRGNVDPKKSGEVRNSVRRVLDGMYLPTGYTWSFGEAFEEEDRTQAELLINLLLALVLVYLVMAALFESLLHPFAIMFALPFAFVGIAVTCLLTGSPFNLMAQIGILILVGIVVNNGIVLVHHVHQLRERGVERTRAILDAAHDRLRPILMTMLCTVLGMLPLAIGGNHVGDVLYYPLARAVMGGLVASTLLTLLLVPCLYTLLEDGAALVARVWRSGPRGAAPATAPVAAPATNS